MCRRTDPPDVVATTSGRPIPGVEVRIVDDDGADVPAGSDGDVLVRTTGVMAGYLDDAEATAAVVDLDGWVHTGDVGHVDDAGNLAVTDRRKDLVIVGGFNVSPAEVEDALLAHPGVAAAAVVAGPDERLGEVPVAFVVPAAGPPSADELVAWCRDRLAGYKVPRAVHPVDGLPLTTAGKVRKDVLRDRLRARTPTDRRGGSVTTDLVQTVVDRFNAMLAGDGARLDVVAEAGDALTLRYVAPAGDAACEACVLDPDDLEVLVAEALQRHGSSIAAVAVER